MNPSAKDHVAAKDYAKQEIINPDLHRGFLAGIQHARLEAQGLVEALEEIKAGGACVCDTSGIAREVLGRFKGEK